MPKYLVGASLRVANQKDSKYRLLLLISKSTHHNGRPMLDDVIEIVPQPFPFVALRSGTLEHLCCLCSVNQNNFVSKGSDGIESLCKISITTHQADLKWGRVIKDELQRKRVIFL